MIPSRYYNEPPFPIRKTITFAGTSALGLAGTAVPVFDITGEVLINYIVAWCSTLLVEAGATSILSMGVVGNTQLFIVNTEPEDIGVNEFWTVIAPSAVGGVALDAKQKDILISANVILDPTTDDTDSGVLEITALWTPVSADGKLVAA